MGTDQEELKLAQREHALIQELIKTKQEQKQPLEFESFEGYELPPRTQFSMLKKPAVSIKYGQMTFNMACIRLFEGVQYILPLVNVGKKRFAAAMCMEEESASVEWARFKKNEVWVNKTITSVDFIEKIYQAMGWQRECRYKVLGRLANSDRGLILVFDLDEAIMFAPFKEEYDDPLSGTKKKRQVKYYPDLYKTRIGRSYDDYEQARQMNLFEDIVSYQEDGSSTQPITVEGSEGDSYG